MYYFTEVSSYETYDGKEDDFHFIYNANTGGGQSFLGGRFRDSSGNLQAPILLDGLTAQFCFRFVDGDGTAHNAILNDEATSYEIKPRADGSRSMKFGVEGKPTPSDVVAAFLMLPETCGVKRSADVNTSVLNSKNYWLQSMWLDVDLSVTNKAIFIPRDCVFCGGVNKDGDGTPRYFAVNFDKRMIDVIRISGVESLDAEVAKCVKHFSDIYQGIKPFVFSESVEAIKEVMRYLSTKYPETYSGTLDPLMMIRELAHIKDGAHLQVQAEVRSDILAAIRTKPFVLLAGISGTGKSRMVRQLARGLCPDESPLSLDPQDPTKKANKPGNFESIPVKPNWHDSTELLGYVTRITEDKKPKFVLTPFVKFLAKAWMNENVPFFLCLDEMNLAPVEQYFAEYLSVIESRDWVDKDDPSKGIQTDVMVRFDVAQSSPGAGAPATTENFVKDTVAALLEKELASTDAAVKAKAEALQSAWGKDGGIRIPANLVVMGTVNMDETTCTFSRKVLDRAMSFELNIDDAMYDAANLPQEGNLVYGSIDKGNAKCELLTGDNAYQKLGSNDGDKILKYIKALNVAMKDTQFKIAYRSRNEILIYCRERTKGGIVGLKQAIDEATSMKILSRIEGDDQKFSKFKLGEFLKTVVKELLRIDNAAVADTDVDAFLADADKVAASPSASKLKRMRDDLDSGTGFVSYWEC